ncbi:hypothetical protein Tco_0398177 [Tanacetum coccineum]
MRESEVHKFSDGTLTRILEKLDHMVKDFVLFKFNPVMENRIWSEDDKRRSKEFIEVIERRFKIRRIFRSLESFVSGRLRDVTTDSSREPNDLIIPKLRNSFEAEWLRNLGELHEILIWTEPIAPISIRCDRCSHKDKAFLKIGTRVLSRGARTKRDHLCEHEVLPLQEAWTWLPVCSLMDWDTWLVIVSSNEH